MGHHFSRIDSDSSEALIFRHLVKCRLDSLTLRVSDVAKISSQLDNELLSVAYHSRIVADSSISEMGWVNAYTLAQVGRSLGVATVISGIRAQIRPFGLGVQNYLAFSSTTKRKKSYYRLVPLSASGVQLFGERKKLLGLHPPHTRKEANGSPDDIPSCPQNT